MKNLVKGIALVGAATTAGIAPKHPSSNTPERRGHWGDLIDYTPCTSPGVNFCQINNTHLALDANLFKRNPDGTLSLVPHPDEEPNFHSDLVVGLGVAFTFLTIIGCAVLQHIHRHTRNGIPIAEIPMATITNQGNVVPPPNSILGPVQEHLRVTINNVLPHRREVHNAIPTPTSLPPDIGIRGVPLNPQIQQPHPGPVASSAPQQQTSNLGQGLHLQPRESRHNTGVGASLVFADTRQQPASENPDNAPQASASSRIPSSSPSNIQSPPRHHTDIPPGPPLQYR